MRQHRVYQGVTERNARETFHVEIVDRLARVQLVGTFSGPRGLQAANAYMMFLQLNPAALDLED